MDLSKRPTPAPRQLPAKAGSPTMMIRLTSLVLFSVAVIAKAADLPDPRLTPGRVDARVTQENIGSTICVRGYTQRVRPSPYFTNSLKRRQIVQYHYTDTHVQDYEEDHLIPLNIGGHPTDELNLWPEPRESVWGAARKDELEYVLHRLVCGRQIGLAEAQAAIAKNWIAAYHRYVGLRGRQGNSGEE